MWRQLAYGVPLALIASAWMHAWGSFSLTASLIGLACLNIAGLLRLRQSSAHASEIFCGPGSIRIRNAGSRSQTVRAQDVTGASTARTDKGFLLSVGHARRDEPISIEVETEEDIAKLRHALGVGHGGFGRLEWRTAPSNVARAGAVGRAVAIGGVGIGLLAGLMGPDIATLVGIACFPAAFLGFLLGLVGMISPPPPPSLALTPDGVGMETENGWILLPYDRIVLVESDKNALTFAISEPCQSVRVKVSSPWAGHGLGAHARRGVLAQLRAAAGRARGLGPAKVDATGRVETLHRRGESARDWLVRLDLAGRMLIEGGGYRGQVLDRADLWAILEDPEAQAELRAAAARILRHLPRPEARVRIASTLAAVRDEETSLQLRIAIGDDIEHASQELAMLDARQQASAAIATAESSPQGWRRGGDPASRR